MYHGSALGAVNPEFAGVRRAMIRITYAQRSRVYPGVWLPPETVELPQESARQFLSQARAGREFHILHVRRCGG